MKTTESRIVAGNLAVPILLAIILPHLMISPGKLIDAHVELTTDCFACHTPFWAAHLRNVSPAIR